MEEILEYLAPNIQYEIKRQLTKIDEDIEEIRIRTNRPLVLKTASKNNILDHIVTTEEILQTFQKVCEQSIYSYQKQICEGFITIKGGHRVGLVGSCVIENGKIININYISSLNFRIAREKRGVSNNILKYVIENKEVKNTLIASKPGVGKTTLLRDLIRRISTGIDEYGIKAKTCGIIDERGEIAAMYKGIPQNDIGTLCDVIENSTKSAGMRMLIRSMAPEIIACDEIGSKEDIRAINYAICSGTKGIFTVHGSKFEELVLNSEIEELLNKHIIETVIFLDDEIKGKIKEIYKLDKDSKKYLKIVL